MLKRLAAMLLCLVMVLSMMPMQAAAADMEELDLAQEETSAAEATEETTEAVEETTEAVVETAPVPAADPEPVQKNNANARDAELGVEKDNNHYFSTFEELKELAKLTFGDEERVYYEGDGQLVFAADITLPETMNLNIYPSMEDDADQTLVIPQGVTVTNQGIINISKMQVDGTLVNENFAFFADQLTVNGSVENHSEIGIGYSAVLRGEAKIKNMSDDAYCIRDFWCRTEEELLAAAAKTASVPDGWRYFIEFDPNGKVTLNTSVTFGKHCWVNFMGTTITIAPGVTLRLDGAELRQYSNLVVEGALVNNGFMESIMENGRRTSFGENGSYSGSGDWWIYVEDTKQIPVKEVVINLTGDNLRVLDWEYAWEIKPHPAHAFEKSEVVEPTCTEDGYTVYICWCGESYTEPHPMLEHSWDEGKVIKEPTDMEAGCLEYTCTRCGDTKTTQIPSGTHVHQYEEETVEPTCTDKGYTKHTCKCGDSYEDNEIDALGHTGGTATCKKLAICDRCEEAYGELDGDNHAYTETVVKPTYTSKGYTLYTCSDCGTSVKDQLTAVKALPTITIKVTADAKSGKPVVSWKDLDDPNLKYEVYRATSSKGTYKRRNTVTGTSYTDTSAEAGKTYYYKVKVVAGSKTKMSSYQKGYCKLAAPVVKAAVTNTTGQVKLSWKKISGAKRYAIYRITSAGKSTRIATTKNLYYTDTGATVGTTYTYKVVALYSSSSLTSSYNSAQSTGVQAMRICAQADLKVSIATNGNPSLSWKSVKGASAYNVYRSESKSGEYLLLTTATGTSYKDNSAEFDKDYWYRVDVVGKKEAAGNATDAAVKVHTTCARPSSVKVTLSSKKPKVTWKAVPNATKYEVYRATSKNGKYTRVRTTTSLSYRDTNAKKGTTYYYKVKAAAANSKANSAFSSIVSIRSK